MRRHSGRYRESSHNPSRKTPLKSTLRGERSAPQILRNLSTAEGKASAVAFSPIAFVPTGRLPAIAIEQP